MEAGILTIGKSGLNETIEGSASGAGDGDLKKFTADRLLAQIEAEQRGRLLDLLAKANAAHKHRSQFQVWQEGFHPQAIYRTRP